MDHKKYEGLYRQLYIIINLFLHYYYEETEMTSDYKCTFGLEGDESTSVSHPVLRNKAGCISYMRQEDNIYNNRVYRDKYHKTSEYLLHSGRLITK
jgi:hypothetical protein